jgi:hypothetical protein
VLYREVLYEWMPQSGVVDKNGGELQKGVEGGVVVVKGDA